MCNTSIPVSICLAAWLPGCLAACLSVSVCLSASVCVYLSVCVCLSICLSVCLSVWHVFLYLCVNLYIFVCVHSRAHPRASAPTQHARTCIYRRHPLPKPIPPPGPKPPAPPPGPRPPAAWQAPIWPLPAVYTNGTTALLVARPAAGEPLFELGGAGVGAAGCATLAAAFERYSRLR